MQPAPAPAGQGGHHAEDEKGWRLSYSVPPEEMRSVAMPEPRHRCVVCVRIVFGGIDIR